MDKTYDAGWTERMMEKYHFEKEAEGRIRELTSDLKDVVKLRMRYRDGEFRYGDILAGITLGEAADRLCDKLTKDGRLTDAYMADCILCEMLMDAYDVFREKFHQDTGKYVTYMKFIGDRDIPAEHLRKALQMLAMNGLRCTSGGMMAPSKSVVFYAGVSAQKPEKCVSVCAECGNTKCGQREKNRKKLFDFREKNMVES